jgi:hypothetical protein
MGTRVFFLGVKQLGREADHSSPSNAEVKNAWSYASTSPMQLHGVVLSYIKKKSVKSVLGIVYSDCTILM